jgi:phage protein D
MSKLVGKNVRGTFFKVSFPTFSSSRVVQPSLVQLVQKQGSHEILSMEFRNAIPSWMLAIKTGVPVQFQWNQGKQSNTWIGYVSFISKEASAQRNQPMIIRCIGASFSLKQSVQRVFRNKSIQDIAKLIAEENGFSFVGDTIPNQVRYEQLVISGESYWEWLQAKAAYIGCVVYVTGTKMFFKKFTSLINMGSTNVPIFQMWDSAIPSAAVGIDRTLSYFKILSGEYVEGNKERRSQKLTGGIDPLTGKTFYGKATPKKDRDALRRVTADVLFNDPITTNVIHGPVMAKSVAEGAAFLAQFSVPAQAIGQGDPRIRPYFPVYIEGTGKDSDGYWMVDEAVHEFHISGEYRVKLRLLTDGIGVSKASPFRQAIASVAGTVNLTQALINKTPKLSTSPNTSSKLTVKSPIIKQGNQGFVRTPTRWRATATSKVTNAQ